jgi:ATP-binding cassette subfamily B protein
MLPTVREPLSYLIKITWRYSQGQRGRLLLYLGLALAAVLVGLFEPYAIAQVVNAAQQGLEKEGAAQTIFFWLAVFAGLEFSIWCFHGPSRVIEREVSYQVRCQYRLALFRAISALPLHWQREHHSGESIERVQRAAGALGDQVSESFLVVHLIARFIGSLLMLCIFLPEAGVLVVLITSIVCAVNILFDRVIFKQDQELNSLQQRIASAIHDYLTNITTLISLRLAPRAEAEVYQRMKVVEAPFARNARTIECKWFLTTMLVQALIVITMGLFLYRAMQSGQVVLAGTLVMLFEYLRRVGESFFNFAWKYGDIMVAASKVYSAQGIVEDLAKSPALVSSQMLPAGWRELEIRNLSFSYTDQDGARMHVDDISFTLRRGEAVAFVGESGSGKSTTLALLRGLEQASKVELRCDGKLLSEGLRVLAQHVTLIPQAPELFAESVRFNVSVGREATDAELLQVLERARFTEVLQRLPTGLATNIAEKGISLSGGERQRLALARGLFYAQESQIILLDEPTSSVDPFNERLIYQRLIAESRDKLLISALHRPHLLPLFDTIYVFEDGVIVERGSYEELSKPGTRFSRILQADAEQRELEKAA